MEAYRVLNNDQSRRAYDAECHSYSYMNGSRGFNDNEYDAWKHQMNNMSRHEFYNYY